MISEEAADEQAISDEEYEEAARRGQEMRLTLPRAISVRFNPDSRCIELELNRGYSIHFAPERAQELAEAADGQLEKVEVTGVGSGIYFPELDADFSVAGLAEGRFGNDAWEKAWAEAHCDQPQLQAA